MNDRSRTVYGIGNVVDSSGEPDAKFLVQLDKAVEFDTPLRTVNDDRSVAKGNVEHENLFADFRQFKFLGFVDNEHEASFRKVVSDSQVYTLYSHQPVGGFNSTRENWISLILGEYLFPFAPWRSARESAILILPA
jgi:hypothetical protein